MGGKTKITKPTLLLDKNKCLANIKAMAEKASKHGLVFRPHFKTHQSLEIGRWFRSQGVEQITVSSLSMAGYFANDGWIDITVAFPVNVLEMEAINQLAEKITLNLLVESIDAIELLNPQLTSSVNIFIKADTGYGRTGIDSTQTFTFQKIIEAVEKSKMMDFSGFLAHAGHSYKCRNVREIEEVHNRSIARMMQLKENFIYAYPNIIASIGDTPTCSVVDNFEGIDEIRPGNFVFFDIMQQQIGSCSFNDIAVVVACPVVAVHPERSEIVVYGGGVHFSKDKIEDEGKVTFGKVAENKNNARGKVIENAFVKSLSQEHGIISAPESVVKETNIGDLVMILPVHSCMTADLMSHYVTLEGERIEKRVNSLE